MEELRVRSWLELQQELFAGSWNQELGRFRSSFAYRGVSDASTDLSAALCRPDVDFTRHERALLRAFRKYAHGGDVPLACTTVWDWLALAQHHGLPTRLLDWTYSPYVALHFLTENRAAWDRDGAVWCVDYRRTNTLLPRRLRAQLTEEGADVFTAGMLAHAAEDLPALDRLARHPFVLFFEPPSLDARIVNQFALFSLMNGPAHSLDDFLAGQRRGVRRLVLPAELKPEVRDKLDQANITERVLFPGLDGLSRWLRRYYTPGRVVREGGQALVRDVAVPLARRRAAARRPRAGGTRRRSGRGAR